MKKPDKNVLILIGLIISIVLLILIVDYLDKSPARFIYQVF